MSEQRSEIGKPKTVGELRVMMKGFTFDTPLAVRNAPLPTVYYFKSDGVTHFEIEIADISENNALTETIKGYQSVVDIANASNATQQKCIDNLNETIKGLDRATVEYTRIIAERDCIIGKLKDTVNGREDLIEAFRYEVESLKGELFEALTTVSIHCEAQEDVGFCSYEKRLCKGCKTKSRLSELLKERSKK